MSCSSGFLEFLSPPILLLAAELWNHQTVLLYELGCQVGFQLSSCSPAFHLPKVAIQRSLASQVSHSALLQPSFIACHFHLLQKPSSLLLGFLLSASPFPHPPALESASFCSMLQLGEQKASVFLTRLTDTCAGHGSLIAADERKGTVSSHKFLNQELSALLLGPCPGIGVNVSCSCSMLYCMSSLMLVPRWR